MRFDEILAERLRAALERQIPAQNPEEDLEGDVSGFDFSILLPILLEVIVSLLGNCPAFRSSRVALAQSLQQPTLLQKTLIRGSLRWHGVSRADREPCCAAICDVMAGATVREITGFCNEMDEVRIDWRPWG